MKHIKIKIPKIVSEKKILKYFQNKDFFNILKIKEENKKLIQNTPYYPELNDLYRLSRFIIENKRTTILEFGTGWSTLIILSALIELEKKYFIKIKDLRKKDKFKLFVVDNEKKYLNISKNRILEYKKKINYKKNNISFLFSDIDFKIVNNQYCNLYRKIPLCNPDFIYLDGPNLFKIKGKQNNFTNKHIDMMPMVANILNIEPFLLPGTIILSDGRTSNMRFLKNNLKKNWIYIYDEIADQNLLYLDEKPIGKINKNFLNFYNS
jgi:hypothetical protein